MTPTRQEMLDAINIKIARTSQSDDGTWYYLPHIKMQKENPEITKAYYAKCK